MAKPAVPVSAAAVPPSVADHRRRLEELRDLLTETIRETGARDRAPLAGQLRAVLNDLAALPAVTEASTVDDLAAQRARRRAASSAS